MYDELISSLRICGKINSANDNCIAFHDGSCEAEPVCMYELMDNAADAIEELQKALDAVNDAHNEGYDVGYWAGRRDYEPNWIPVTERLPEESDRYMVIAVEPWFGTVSAEIMKYRVNENLWVYDGRITEATVTHWMPLPPAPKEE